MRLNIARGNMYEFIDYTANPINGQCPHKCFYCYMKRYGTGKPLGLKEWELNIKTGCNRKIFVGDSTDMFAESVKSNDILRVLNHCHEYKNEYFFQSKNPVRFLEFIKHAVIKESILCTTIETNRHYKEFMGNCPSIEERVQAMEQIRKLGIKTHVTIEPIMDFDLDELLDLMRRCNPIQVNIGKNTSVGIVLPHPSKEKTVQFITELQKFTIVHLKRNIRGK